MTDAEKKVQMDKATEAAKAVADAAAAKLAAETKPPMTGDQELALQAVRDAEVAKDVADRKAHSKTLPFEFHGKVGTTFRIAGKGFGVVGVVTIAGRPVTTTQWRDDSIKGPMIPSDLPNGPTEVTVKGHAMTVPLKATFEL